MQGRVFPLSSFSTQSLNFLFIVVPEARRLKNAIHSPVWASAVGPGIRVSGAQAVP